MNKRLIPPFIIIIIAIISTLYFFAAQRSDTALSDEPVELHANPPNIIMFGTRSCQYCKLARQFFDKHHLPYTEHDIELSDEHRRMFDLLGGQGTPLLIINKEVIHGFDENEMRKAL